MARSAEIDAVPAQRGSGGNSEDSGGMCRGDQSRLHRSQVIGGPTNQPSRHSQFVRPKIEGYLQSIVIVFSAFQLVLVRLHAFRRVVANWQILPFFVECTGKTREIKHCPRRESNPYLRFRKPPFYPLNYGGEGPPTGERAAPGPTRHAAGCTPTDFRRQAQDSNRTRPTCG